MSCRICSAGRDIPFNQKQRCWLSKVIHDFNIMESISMDLKVMPTSFRGYTDTDTDTDNFVIVSSGICIVKYIFKSWNNQQLIIITVVLVSYTHFTIVFYISLFKELGFRIYGCWIIIIHN